LRVCCSPVRRQRRWRYAIEVFGVCAKGTRRTLNWRWRNSGKNIDAAPAIDVVRRTRCAAQGRSNMNCCVV
jgi:hypothetical protein